MVEGIEFGKWYIIPGKSDHRYFFIQYIHSDKRFGMLDSYGMYERLNYSERTKKYVRSLFKWLEPLPADSPDARAGAHWLFKRMFDIERLGASYDGIRAMMHRGIS